MKNHRPETTLANGTGNPLSAQTAEGGKSVSSLDKDLSTYQSACLPVSVCILLKVS